MGGVAVAILRLGRRVAWRCPWSRVLGRGEDESLLAYSDAGHSLEGNIIGAGNSPLPAPRRSWSFFEGLAAGWKSPSGSPRSIQRGAEGNLELMAPADDSN